MKQVYLVKSDGTFAAWMTETQALQVIESAKEGEYTIDPIVHKEGDKLIENFFEDLPLKP